VAFVLSCPMSFLLGHGTGHLGHVSKAECPRGHFPLQRPPPGIAAAGLPETMAAMESQPMSDENPMLNALRQCTPFPIAKTPFPTG
jgi:hypothetical protein